MESTNERRDRREFAVLFLLAVLSLVLTLAVIALQLARAGTRRVARPIVLAESASEVIPDASGFFGSPRSPYVLIEFGDYQCPACLTVMDRVRQLVQKHNGTLKFTYRHLPLPSHNSALPAAYAAEAAGIQGKFWEMHDALLALGGDLSDQRIKTAARRIGLDMQRFARDRGSTAAQSVGKDIKTAERLAIRATPTFLLAVPSGKVYRLPDLTWVDRAMEEYR